MIDRIKIFIDSQNISVSAFEKKISASDGMIRRAINHKTDIQSKWILKMSENYPELNLEWLITGKGQMLNQIPNRTKELNTNSNIDEPPLHNKIPLISQSVDTGFGVDYLSMENVEIKTHYVIPIFEDVSVDFMIEVSGNSMDPKYYSGDVIACSIVKVSKFVQWNNVYAIATQEHGLLVKRIMEVGNNTIIAVSDNPDYPPLKIPKEEITGTALVVGVVRLE